MTRKVTRLMAAALMLAATLVGLRAAQGLHARVKSGTVGVAAARGGEGDFMRRVYEAQVARARADGKAPRENLREDQLGLCEAGHRLRKDAAAQCRLLLEQARADLRRQKEGGNPEALKVSDIGVHSAYRSVERDEAAWRGAFRKHLRETKDTRAKLKGGEYGAEAVEMMVKIMRRFKAAPRFSDHTGGTAVDFTTTEHGVRLTANSNQNGRWKNSWFYKWLTKNAGRFKFKPLATEAWHWEYAKRHESRAGI